MNARLNVLVVEDSEDDAVLLERELNRGGFRSNIVRVETEQEMESALGCVNWDIIITDHSMPGFSSTAAIDTVRRAGLDVPVIIVSGSIGEEIAVAAMKSGASDYIMKNNLSRLIPAIERELREADVRRAHRRAEETILHMAYHDALTGLANRHEFERCLDRALRSARERHLQHALMYLDLDQFKIVNDTSGHVAGDEMLRQLAVVLQGQIREQDTLARLGGDEFGILLESCPGERAQRIAESMLEEVKKFRFSWNGRVFSVGASIGMVEITCTDTSIADLMSAADMACYAAKDKGRSRVNLFRADDKELIHRRGQMQWASRINHAVEESRLVLHQQAIIAVDGAKAGASHCELLLRMLDSSGAMVYPGMFIPAAERYGLMSKLDRWVVRAAIEHIATTTVNDGSSGDRPVFFVNLSGMSLNDDELFEFVKSGVKEYGIPPECLCFEITETAAIVNLATAVRFINEIRDLGCHFALDDFGTGMSSFTYLKEIPVDYLKIDGGFVKDMIKDPMDRAIVRAINEIGHVAGLKTIAESVESEDIRKELQVLGVDFAQGYGIDYPGPLSGYAFGRQGVVNGIFT